MAQILLGLAATILIGANAMAADLDQDGLDDAWETANGYNTLLYTRIVHVNTVGGNDATGDGLTAATALKTLGAALALNFTAGEENVILVAPGIYSGSANRELDFNGKDIWLRASGNASQTIIDLEGAGRFLALTQGETAASRLEGFTVRNGYKASQGTAIHLAGASLTIRDCVFEGNASGRWTGDWWEGGVDTAAVYSTGAPVTVEDCVFLGNASHGAESENTGPMGGTGNCGALLLVSSQGSRIERCTFAGNRGVGAGAVLLAGASASLDACRFLRNHSSGGGAITTKENYRWDEWTGQYITETASAALANCLFLRNRALSGASDIRNSQSCTLSATNCTLAEGESGDGTSLSLLGDAAFLNTVVAGTAHVRDGASISASHCLAPADWSAFGAGNIAADPMLTGAGMLRAGSPCIDAGTDTGAPATDLLGNARPAGNAPEIGCHEFQDTDGDGIPDLQEGNSDILPNGDEDGDGLANLQEYLLGTDIFAADTDADGIGDAAELAAGYDPAFRTNVIHVDATAGDDTNDGSTSSLAVSTLSRAIAIACGSVGDNVVSIAPGIYSGEANRGLDFGGTDIRLASTAGAAQTIIDLGGSGPFLRLSGGESTASQVQGLTIRNGFAMSKGMAITLEGASLTIRDCVFEGNRSGSFASGQWHGGYATAAVYAEGGAIDMMGCSFLGNCSRGEGGDGEGGYEQVGNAGALSLVDSSGSMVAQCTFAGNRGVSAGAVLLTGASATFRACRFARNLSATQGGAISAKTYEDWENSYSSTSSAVLENCLLLGNRARSGAADVQNGYGCTLSATNCTLAEGESGDATSLRLLGNATLLNTVVAGAAHVRDGASISATRCLAPAAWSAFGTGNIAADPMLTGAGMLRAGSPCIDAGTAEGAPATDILGNARPAGSGVDIGCHEFLDADGDGIPDILEGDGVLPYGDSDGDGLANIREYLLGTDIFAADTDGDGIGDAAELAAGYDPALRTNVTHVDAAAGDDASNGSAQSPLSTIAAAVAAAQAAPGEQVVLVAPGTYSGTGNRNIDFGGIDIILASSSGSAATVIDLEGAGPFLGLTNSESTRSRLDGFTVRNGYADTGGTAVHLANASLDIRNCVFEGNVSGRRTGSYWTGGIGTAAVRAQGRPVLLSDCVFRDNASLGPAGDEWSGPEAGAGSCGGLLLVSSQGSEILRCRFAGNRGRNGGGALLSGASATFRACAFRHNLSAAYGGGISAKTHDDWENSGGSSPSSTVLENCLFLGNRALSGAADVQNGYGCTLSAASCTLAEGKSGDATSLRLLGNATLLNTVVAGAAYVRDGASISATRCLAPAAWSQFGAGNIAADPMLTGAGMLRAGSPCIDAGTAEGAPEADILGNARPAGSGVDIGCHEFLDEDGDGIPDILEGDGVLPDGDEDGDGLANLAEYLMGTSIGAADTDVDGLDDGEEVRLGLNPLLPTSAVFVDAANGNDANAGLSSLHPKASLSAAIAALPETCAEFAVLVAPGVYSGSANRNLSFNGRDVILRSLQGAFFTVVNMGMEGRFLSAENGETDSSRIDGFHLRGGCAGQGGALLVRNSGLSIENCIIDGNTATAGAAINAANSTLVLRNVLLDANTGMNSTSASTLEMSGGTTTIVNCTLRQPAGGVLVSGSGTCSMTNTIVAGSLAGPSFSAAYCCTTSLLSGEGNISGDAGLLPNGYLAAGSQCIDAGTTSAAPSRDLYGQARPAGSGVDIGCLEFLDADGDGIADSYELLLCGKNLLPNDDDDNDGLTNLQEYLAGLDATSLDTDGDGMDDGWETTYSFDPLSDDAWLDADGDQLANIEEFRKGLNPRNTDTDGDGMDDCREVLLGLNPADATDLDADSDGDGVSNRNEILTYGTDHLNSDTDGDGIPDGLEIAWGMNPLAPASRNAYGGGFAYERETPDGASSASLWNVSAGALFTSITPLQEDGFAWHVETGTTGEVAFAFPSGMHPLSKVAFRMRTTASFAIELHYEDSSGLEYYTTLDNSGCGSSSVNGNARTAGLGTWVANGNWHPVLVDPVAELREIAPAATIGSLVRIVLRGTLDIGGLTLLRYPDADHDGIPDSVETHFGLSPNTCADAGLDHDSDGLCNRHEFLYGTSIVVADTDSDGLSDGDEVKSYGTNPLVADQDGDGIADGWEISHFSSLSRNGSGDYDSDGLSDYLEFMTGGDPLHSAVNATANQLLLELYTILANLVEN